MAQLPSMVKDLKNTHLMDWLSYADGHCMRGSRDWCMGYLHSARDYIFALVNEINNHPEARVPIKLDPEEHAALLALGRYRDRLWGIKDDHTYQLPKDFKIEKVSIWIKALERIYAGLP